MKPTDIARLISVSDPTVSPDGRLVAYVVRRVDGEANRYRSAIWLAPTGGDGAPRQLTAGDESDSGPVWSPTSDAIAFTSARGVDEKHRASLHIIPVDRVGETATLASRDEEIGGVAWSPDGRRIAFTSRVRAPRWADGDDDRARPPRKIDHLLPRLDSEGWTIDRPVQLFVVPVDGTAAPRRVTMDEFDYDAPSWAPDSRRIATTAARHTDWDLDTFNDVWVIDVDDVDAGDDDAVPVARQVTRTDASYHFVSWEPAGERIAVLRGIERIGYRHTRVAVVDSATGHAHVITDHLDLTCAPFPTPRPPAWVDDQLYFAVEERGRVPVLSIDAGGGPVRRVVDGHRTVTGYDIARADPHVVAFTATSLETGPGELYVLAEGAERQLTHHQDAFIAACPPLPTEHLTVSSPDGMELDAWVVLPPDFDPAGSYPALLNIHGGPHTQYGERWFDEFQLYASGGYVVVYANPRGSTGYSEDSARVLLSAASSEDPGEGWGPPAFDDLMAVTDAVLHKYPAIDANRFGVMGGSYGGYMTSWIVGHTTRFAAACSERAVNNVASLEWSSDAAGLFRWAMGASHLDAPEEYARLSPITYVRDIATPVLILHSEEDLRCPTEQADALWVAMRLLGKDVEYYRFPAESHELTRSGSPKHRTQRAQLVLDYFDRKMPASS